MNATALNLAETICQECQQAFFYEPILVMGRDFGKALNTHCEGCNAKAERETKERESAAEKAEREARVQALPIDLLETDVEFPSFNRELWEVVSQWKPSLKSLGLAIIGPGDRSKTRCMTLAAIASIRRGCDVKWTTANRLFDAAQEIRHSTRSIATAAREHLQECRTARVLFLDDLGKNQWSADFEKQLFYILDHRKNHRLPLVYSSNCHPHAFSQVLSEFNRDPIIGRLLDRMTIIDLFETSTD